MIDFLGALLAHGDARLPMLERRPRALFEPAEPRPVFDLHRAEVAEALEGAAPLDPHPGHASVQAARQPAAPAGGFESLLRHRSDPKAFGLYAAEPTSHVATPAFDVSSVSPAQPPAPHPESADSQHRAAPSRATLQLATQAGPLDLVRAPKLRLRPHPRAEPEAAANADLPRTASRPTPVPRGADHRAVGPAPSTASEPTAASRDPREAAPLVAQRSPARATPSVSIARARDVASARRDSPAAAQPLPAVQISIGRVEIRATQAAAPAPRQAAPAAPRLSLDDYLRSRNGVAR